MTSNKDYSLEGKCTSCGSKRKTYSNGYVVCIECGTTGGREIVDHLPSKYDSNNEKISHNSIGKNIEFIGALGSQVGKTSGFMRGANGEKLKHKMVQKYRRLSKFYQNRAQLEGNATHLRTMVAFNAVFAKLGLSKDIKLRCLFLYWKYVNGNFKITNHILLIALCLLQAIREAKSRAPVRFSEVVKAFSENGHRVTNKNILRLAREMDINLSPNRRKAEDYIERIAAHIRNNKEIKSKITARRFSIGEYELLLIKIANEFLKMLSRKDRGGVQPYPFAVSVIYLSDRALGRTLNRKPVLTQNLLANAADSAEFTIRDHVYRFLGDLYKDREEKLIRFVNSQLN